MLKFLKKHCIQTTIVIITVFESFLWLDILYVNIILLHPCASQLFQKKYVFLITLHSIFIYFLPVQPKHTCSFSINQSIVLKYALNYILMMYDSHQSTMLEKFQLYCTISMIV